jgi:hypothetical protein
MAKPRVDMTKLSVPKAAAAAAVPFIQTEETRPVIGESKSLTVRLNLRDYWALRDFCAQHERQTGERLTHQEAMVRGLHCLLGKGDAA